jgi:hypothetical protein
MKVFCPVNDAPADGENRLKTAENRLSQAIHRLETAMAGRNLEHPELHGQVQDLLRENNELRSIVSASVEKLDGAIGQFKTMLAR